MIAAAEAGGWPCVARALGAAHGGQLVDDRVVIAAPSGAAVVVHPARVAGRACAVVVVAIGHAVRADLAQVLVLAKDLELGSVVIVAGALALRHLVPLDRGDPLDEIVTAIAWLGRDAVILRGAVLPRRAPGAAALAFAGYVD